MRFVVMGLVVMLAGCAGQPSDETSELAANASESSDLICHTEKVTGSYRRVEVCRTKAQIEAEDAESRRVLERQQQLNNTGASGGDT